MPILLYLAMTAAEMRICEPLPPKLGWLACHFSLSGTGLTNVPTAMPPKSLLILDDSTPIRGHDAAQVRESLKEAVERLDCSGILLDFENPPSLESMAMVRAIAALPCPVCAPPEYAADLSGPVFLPPIDLLQTPEEALRPWAGREIWLDCAPAALTVTVTEKGSQAAPLSVFDAPECPHFDEELCCHYRLDLSDNQAVFTLHRTTDDCRRLLEASQKHGVTTGIALWQEFTM